MRNYDRKSRAKASNWARLSPAAVRELERRIVSQCGVRNVADSIGCNETTLTKLRGGFAQGRATAVARIENALLHGGVKSNETE